MKKLGFSAFALLAAFVSAPSQAVTNLPTTFPVNITLTSACVVTTAPGAVAFSYTSMQGTSATATGTSVGIKCTNALPYSVSLATAPGNGYNVVDALTGLAYTLTLAAGAGTPAAMDLTGQVGNGAAQTVNIGGTMGPNQVGTCNAASCTNAGSANQTQTLTITY
jgi:hypothetical protein